MSDCLIVYIERDICRRIDNLVIIQRFKNIKTRRNQLLKVIMSLLFDIFIYINNVY